MTSEAPTSRKARGGMTRRNQVPSKRVQRKASTSNVNETTMTIDTNVNNPTAAAVTSINQNEKTSNNNNNVATTATTSNGSTTTTNNNDNKNNTQNNDTNTNANTINNNPSASKSSAASSSQPTSTTNIWQARKQQKKELAQNKNLDVSGSSSATTSTASTAATGAGSSTTTTQSTKYMPIKRAPEAVEPSKRPMAPAAATATATAATRPAITVESIQQPVAPPESKRITKNPTSDDTTIAVTAPTPSRFASGSGYRPPHQRGANTMIVKPPEETEVKRDSGIQHENKPTSSYFKDKGETMKNTDDARPLRRETMGKGYERKSFPEDSSPSHNDNKPDSSGRRFQDDTGNRGRGFGTRSGFGRDKFPSRDQDFSRLRERDSTEVRNEGNRVNIPRPTAVRSERDVGTTAESFTRTKYENTSMKNEASPTRRINTEKENDSLQYGKNAARSQSLKNETNVDPRTKTTAPKPIQKTFSAPKEQLMKVIKLHGPSEHKDEKIMKIKQQMKEKEKSKPNITPIGGFQPVLSSAQEALRAISDGNMDITRENAEMVQRELGTNLNPLGPEFAPQEPIAELDAEQGHYVVDQTQFTSEQGGSGYESGNVTRNTETVDLSNLSWSFHPSDSGIYAQDFGGETEYDMNNYVDFERNQEMGVDPNMGGPNNAAMSASGLASNGARSQSPEQVPMSHSLNEAYNTQSTATMPSQSLPVTAPGPSPNMLNTGYNIAHATEDLSSQQAPSEVQQVAMKAQQAIQQNPQMFSGIEHGINPPTMVSINPAVALRYPQFAGAIAEHNQGWSVEDLQQMYLSMWQQQQQQQQRMGATGHIPQSAPQNQSTYVSHYNTMVPPSDTTGGQSSQWEWNRRGRGGQQGRPYRGRGRRRFDGQDSRDPTNPRNNEMEANASGNQMPMGRGRYNDRRDYSKKKYDQQRRNYGNYRTKEHGFAQQNRDPNDNINGVGIKGPELNPSANQVDDRSNTNQWGNTQADYGAFGYDGSTEQMMGTFESEVSTNKGNYSNQKGENNSNFPTQFETLTLSDWYFILDFSNPQHIENFQNQLFEMPPPNSLKNFRLELPSSPIQPLWVDRVKWTQLSEYLSQAKLECVEITSHLQTKLDIYNEKDFQELQPVAKFVTSLKCKRLILEHAPCKVTSAFIQSLSNEIEELKLLCSSIEWDVSLVRSLNPRLNYLALICPNTTITIHDFLEALEGKVDRLYLCNDESSSRRLSSEDVWELFKHVLNLELDSSLLTEIRPMSGPGIQSKTESLMIHLKDKVLEKDLYQKCSFPKSITTFNVCHADPSRMCKGWNDNNYNNNNASTGILDNDEAKIDSQHKSQIGYETHTQRPSIGAITNTEDNKLLSNEVTSKQNQGQQGQPSQQQQQQGPAKKMSFKEKLQSTQKVKKPSTLRIGGN